VGAGVGSAVASGAAVKVGCTVGAGVGGNVATHGRAAIGAAVFSFFVPGISAAKSSTIPANTARHKPRRKRYRSFLPRFAMKPLLLRCARQNFQI
jgi:hypothetical protein